jgi:pectin methylesterase-like acyl-CoA thioesterase
LIACCACSDVASEEPAAPDVDASSMPPDAPAETRRDASLRLDARVREGGGGAVEQADDAALPEPQDDAALPPARDEPLFPAPGARGVCPDAPLRIRFAARPTLGTRGSLRVVDRDTQKTVTLDMARPTIQVERGGVTFTSERPAHVVDDTAVFYLPRLEPGHRYAVQLEESVVTGPARPETGDWTFEVATMPTALRVARDGDYCTLQGALDAARDGSTITLAADTYHGIVYTRGKRSITIRGDERERTRLVGTNNERLNPGTAKRALIGLDDSSEITFERLTIENLTPQGGSQAEALRMQRCDRCVVRDATIRSLQDTLLWSGRVYAEDCTISGNVDFIWGTGSAFFRRCQIETRGRGGYVVQARNPAAAFGYVFVDSRFTGEQGVGASVLARIDASVYPASHVAVIDCTLGAHIDPVGWQVTGDSTALRFWEHGSRDASGSALDVSRRHARSRQLGSEEAARMRDPKQVLAGWDP